MQNKMPRLVRNVLAAAVVTGISFAAHAADGKINFTGTILDSACTVNTGTATQTVDLGQIPKSSFSAKGDVAAATRFTIVLDNCPTAVKTASVKFDGTADANDTSILALSSGQTAKGVGVALYEKDGVTPIPLATLSKSLTLDTTASYSNQMAFVAKYKATEATVTAGTANASSDFTITYQ